MTAGVGAVADLRHRHHAVDDLPAEQALLERETHVLVHVLDEALEALEDVARRIARVDLEVHLDSRARRGGIDTQPEVGVDRQHTPRHVTDLALPVGTPLIRSVGGEAWARAA